MREIQTDTEAIWAERRQLHDDIRLMASGLVDLVNAAAARLPPPELAEPEGETLKPEAGETQPASVASDESAPVPTVGSGDGGDDQTREQAADRIASGPGT